MNLKKTFFVALVLGCPGGCYKFFLNAEDSSDTSTGAHQTEFVWSNQDTVDQTTTGLTSESGSGLASSGTSSISSAQPDLGATATTDSETQATTGAPQTTSGSTDTSDETTGDPPCPCKPAKNDSKNCNKDGTCTKCGDGYLNLAAEECDDGALTGVLNTNGDATCDIETCKRVILTAFITSMPYTGNLGGYKKADEKCQTLAQSAGLPHSDRFIAWLGVPGSEMTPSYSAAETLNKPECNLPYYLLNGDKLANNIPSLLEQGHADYMFSPINVTEEGGFIKENKRVWSCVSQDGANHCTQATNCDYWTQENASGYTGIARAPLNIFATIKDFILEFSCANANPFAWPYWTKCTWMKCTEAAHLYCFEQCPPAPDEAP